MKNHIGILFILFCTFVLTGNKCKKDRESNESKEVIEVVEEVSKVEDQVYAKNGRESYDKIIVDSAKGYILYPTDDSLFASITRTPCFGRCPVYKISIFSKGEVVYHVKDFVEGMTPGYYRTLITKEQMSLIIAIAEDEAYFELKDKYPEGNIMVADLPTTITFLRIGNKRKQVINGNFHHPYALIRFEEFIDSTFAQSTWERATLTSQD